MLFLLTVMMGSYYYGLNFQFLAFEILFSWVVFGRHCKEPFRGAETKMQMLEVTIIGSHAGSRALTQYMHSHLVGRCNFSYFSVMSS